MNKLPIRDAIKQRILVLDGAMGTLIQQKGLTEADFRGMEFTDHPVPLKGNNDILNLSRPDIVREIHRAYIRAGADIIESNTFNSNAVSQREYACEDLVYSLNRVGARLAREEADLAEGHEGRAIYVAGSMGPTARTLSLSLDMDDPAFRPMDFDALARVYAEQARGLLDGGVDFFLLETVFDALNAKAALYAIARLQEERKTALPVVVSASVSDRSGRLLTGQIIEALYVSASHAPLLAFGLNCSLGIAQMEPLIRALASVLPCPLWVCPNAGLPDAMGQYAELPSRTADCIGQMAQEGLLNVAGGCCGTTPAHIASIREAVQGLQPREIPKEDGRLRLCGLETVVVDKAVRPLTLVGERTNVAGSARFARLIREGKYAEALSVARKQIEDGALLLDVSMDAALIDSVREMEAFVRWINHEPEIAKVPLMLDSSDWASLLAGLKNAQGKCVVNSLSLKDGEEAFLRKAAEVHRLGAALVVMAFDERGQAADYERKIAICQRAYGLLVDRAGFRPEDIIFDVNVLAVGTGLDSDASHAVDFLRAVAWLKAHYPQCKTSGGISNLSFAFRGEDLVRRALHSVFLRYAVEAGLDMAILNPAQWNLSRLDLAQWHSVSSDSEDRTESRLLAAAEAVVLNRNPHATEDLLELAAELRDRKLYGGGTQASALQGPGKGMNLSRSSWRSLPLAERLEHALLKGDTSCLASDLRAALAIYPSAMAVIEGPLMKTMDKVGCLFEEGKMFLPQVVRSAKAMQEAVDLLQGEMGPQRTQGESSSRHPRIVIATAKGDVHDIGKNIAHIVLSCNNFDVIDLGVMVDSRRIVEAAVEQKADIVGISGLITPSLKEMEGLCLLMQEAGLRIPLVVGGATTSVVHTAVKLAPLYDGGVVYGGDASRTALLCKQLMAQREPFLEQLKAEQESIRENYRQRHRPLLSYGEARRRSAVYPEETYRQPEAWGRESVEWRQPDLECLVKRIDWTPFFHFWGFKGRFPDVLSENEEAARIYHEALQKLQEMVDAKEFDAVCRLRFFDAFAAQDDIVLEGAGRLPMLRQQREGEICLSLADFVCPSAWGRSRLGLFALKVEDLKPVADGRDFQHLLRSSLCARLAEALAESMQQHVEAFLQDERPMGRQGAPSRMRLIRPAFGYPACPDHSLKKMVLELLDAIPGLGLELTASYALKPSTALCGMVIAHPAAHYFGLGPVGEDQARDYAARRGISREEVRRCAGI